MRYGLMDRVEFRMFWEGPTLASSPPSGRRRGQTGSVVPATRKSVSSGSLFAGDKERNWIPTTALITSITAPDRRHLAAFFRSRPSRIST